MHRLGAIAIVLLSACGRSGFDPRVDSITAGSDGDSGTAKDCAVWAAGGSAGGITLRWNGTSFDMVSNPSNTSINGLWGAATNDIWGLGGLSTILHWDGAAWSQVSGGGSRVVHGVSGRAANDIWAAGDSGYVVHYDGTGWTPITPMPSGATLTKVSVLPSGQVWVGEQSTNVLHYDGTTWQEIATSYNPNRYALWGANDASVWSVGGGPAQIGLWNGSAFSTSTSSPVTSALRDVYGVSASDIWAVGEAGEIAHYDGTAWTQVASPTSTALYSVWGSGANDFWAAGPMGTVIHWDGIKWSIVPTPTTGTLFVIFGAC